MRTTFAAGCIPARRLPEARELAADSARDHVRDFGLVAWRKSAISRPLANHAPSACDSALLWFSYRRPGPASLCSTHSAVGRAATGAGPITQEGTRLAAQRASGPSEPHSYWRSP